MDALLQRRRARSRASSTRRLGERVSIDLRVNSGRRPPGECAVYLPIPVVLSCRTGRPKPLLTRADGGVEAQSGLAQGPAGAVTEGSKAISCSPAKIGQALRHVMANVLTPVIAGYATDSRAKEESKHSSPPL